MSITTHRTRTAREEDSYDPIAPDGTWQAAWPPEVWLVKWRLHVLGYRQVNATTVRDITKVARALYVAQYGQEPPRRRREAYTAVFEHDRVGVIDQAAAELLGTPRPGEER